MLLTFFIQCTLYLRGLTISFELKSACGALLCFICIFCESKYLLSLKAQSTFGMELLKRTENTIPVTEMSYY